MNQLAPVYDDRAADYHYDRCACGEIKSKIAKQCMKCWRRLMRRRDAAKQWKKVKNKA